MSDIVDRANDEADTWITEKIRQVLNPPKSPFAKGGLLTNITECVDCGDEIGQQRKQALPHAVRCIKCQMVQEGKK